MSEQGGLQAAREGVEKALTARPRNWSWIAAALDVLEWTAKVEALRSVPCTRPTGHGNCARHPLYPKGAEGVYWCDNCLALAAAETELAAALQRREAR